MSEKTEMDGYEGARRQEFINSRYFAKRSAQLITREQFSDIVIERGIFGQPVLSIKGQSTFDVSISHKAMICGALVFPRTHPCAIDIEQLNNHVNPQVWRKTMTSAELKQHTALDQLAVIFSAKEGLSKILRCGLTVPFQLLEVSELQREPRGYRGRFKNFIQYQFQTFLDGEHMLTIVYPRKSVLTVNTPLTSTADIRGVQDYFCKS
jgi:4'-phosphopantetheinyl transferase EntD